MSKQEKIEEALSVIHANPLSHLNHANLLNESQKLDSSISCGDLWHYMQTQYGWDPNTGFWSGELLDEEVEP